MRVRKPDFFAVVTLFVCVGVVITAVARADEVRGDWPSLRLESAPESWSQARPDLSVASEDVSPTIHLWRGPSWLERSAGTTLTLELGWGAPDVLAPAWYDRTENEVGLHELPHLTPVGQTIDMTYISVRQDYADFGIRLGLATEYSTPVEMTTPTLFFGIDNRW